jgi:hypothetical protein
MILRDNSSIVVRLELLQQMTFDIPIIITGLAVVVVIFFMNLLPRSIIVYAMIMCLHFLR